MKKLGVFFGILALLAVSGAAAFVYFGVYNIAATEQHSALTYHVLHYAMRRSVKARSADVKVPPLQDAARLDNGLLLYSEHCLQCHGAPGIAPNPFGLGTRPEPANLVDAARDWPAPEVYWVVKHGIKMTAMPAWEYRLNEQELWDLVAFVKHLPVVSPQGYRIWSDRLQQLPGATINHATSASDLRPGDAAAGRHAIYQYLCVTCHQIPGVVGANQNVGPPLDGIATRKYIGGVLLNTPDNMMRWLRDPQQIDPLSGMPDLKIREQDLRDITAYLYTLKEVR